MTLRFLAERPGWLLSLKELGGLLGFSRVQNNTGINGGRGFYTLRKTAASQIERINPLPTGMFLAHSPREMKKHYAIPHWEALDSAIEEMGRVFGVDSWLIDHHEASESD